MVGSGGIDLMNPDSRAPGGYCVIHAGSSQVVMEPFIANVKLNISFPQWTAPVGSPSSASKKHIYSIASNKQGQFTGGGGWSFWGWWLTP